MSGEQITPAATQDERTRREEVLQRLLAEARTRERLRGLGKILGIAADESRAVAIDAPANLAN